jgi:hypothetical protein
MHVSIHRNRLQKRLRIERGLADAAGLVCKLLSRHGIVNLGRGGPAAGGIEQGEFGGELDAAAAAGIEARVGDVGADVVVARGFRIVA